MTAGRRALVTGAGSGIGAACVDQLLAQGCRVAAVDLHAGDVAARADELEAIHEVDVTDAAAVRAIDGIDQMDIVVQSAGVVGPNVPLLETPLDGWERTLTVNVTGIFNVMQATLGGMVERGWGRVVNIASKIPMGRLGQPSEVAALVGWLCSDECSFSTGACYDISGGRATF